MREDGFSLIELLISFCLLLIFITSSLLIVMNSLLIKRKSELNFLYTRIAINKLEYLKSRSFESEVLKPGVYEEELEISNINVKFKRRWKISKLSQNLKRIELEIWQKNHPEKKTEFILYISKNLRF